MNIDRMELWPVWYPTSLDDDPTVYYGCRPLDLTPEQGVRLAKAMMEFEAVQDIVHRAISRQTASIAVQEGARAYE